MPKKLLAPRDFEPHWRPGLTNSDYHADKTAVSSTGLRHLLESPLHFRAKFLDGQETPPTKAMMKGTMVHEAILEGQHFLDRYVVMPNFCETLAEEDGVDKPYSPNTNRVRHAKRDWLEENEDKLIVDQAEFDKVRWMLDSLLANDDVMAVFKDVTTEIAGFYVDKETGIRCRIKPDAVSRDGTIISDLKTTASLKRFEKAIWDNRYDFQIANYGEGAETINRVKVQYHAFVVVENVRPFESAVFVADAMMVEIGQRDYHSMLRLLRKCIDQDSFPRRHIGFQPIALPGYADSLEKFT